MTVEELHKHNRRVAVNDISFDAVAKTEAIVEMRGWITKWLNMAYEEGFKAGREGKV